MSAADLTKPFWPKLLTLFVSQTMEPLLKGKAQYIDFFVKIACSVKEKYIFSFKTSWSELASTRKSTVLILPLK
jgi:hypothetical protein